MSSLTSRATVYIAFTEVRKKSPDSSANSKFVPAIFYDHQYTASGEPSSELKERVEKLRGMIISNQPEPVGSLEDQSEIQSADRQTLVKLIKAMSDEWIQSARDTVGCDTSDIEVKVCRMDDYMSDLTTPSTSSATH